MTEFHSDLSCPPIPDDVSTAQFLLDSHHPTRPLRSGNIPWLIEDKTGRTIGYEELRSRTYGLANAMHARWGIGNDDVVCIFSPNHVDYPVVIWAAHRLGAIVSCANPAYMMDELVHQLAVSKSFLVISHPDFIDTALAAVRRCNISTDNIVLIDSPAADGPIHFSTVSHLILEGLASSASFLDIKLAPGEGKTKLAFLSFSSGTTGKPKAVAIPHYAVIANVIQMAAYHKVNEPYTTWDKRRFRPGDIAAGVLPFFHIYGLVVNMHWLIFCGISLVVIPKFNFVEFLKSIDRHKVTHLFLVPSQVVLLCKHPAAKNFDLSRIRFFISGAAPLSPELTQQLIKVIPNASIGQGYGMTETCATISMIPVSQHIGTFGSAGQLIPETTARVVKADGTLAGYDEEGELHVTGPQMALRYTNNEEATRETFRDGWVRTGDQVKISRSGEIFVVDRLKEVMKVRGFQVAPAELEGHLLLHPDIADVCVVGVPDEYSGEVPLAFVTLEQRAAQKAKANPEGGDELKKSIIKHVSDTKVHYKWLKGGVEFIDTIPKNPSGKLLRRHLRDKAKEIVAKRTRSVKSKL
ncbi:hypothetical protein EW145_g4156 [Phellinidium pouzarii]|uniref:Phenylacetyl-CoA ligase n=1 Tax=Phellinidium pouzarii TaxID=167371 RepID=A0A4S4L4T6_9AGAM|nr:hypothetical protein EW145_g4156 [Phellinidium pouzarii]